MALMALLSGVSLQYEFTKPAIAQTIDLTSELALSDIRAFGVETNINVHSVESLNADEFNALLLSSHQSGATWANDPLWVGLQFLQYIGHPVTGQNQTVSVFIPGEWEAGQSFDYARVIIEDKGWLDDAIEGERYAMWITPGAEGEFIISRALRANICSRPFQEFYSIQNCP
ncbi:MAG: hypothetical protein AAGD25_31300 [Cyanobacteria bacterium P01_F01_bin.150]